mmetsp:Transcript_3487/g.9441  ORF Transcript_3487/g.9441 Transcript_3487/m.9441 type:complete len:354 (-) Transcript_3487:774-1835(-)
MGRSFAADRALIDVGPPGHECLYNTEVPVAACVVQPRLPEIVTHIHLHDLVLELGLHRLHVPLAAPPQELVLENFRHGLRVVHTVILHALVLHRLQPLGQVVQKVFTVIVAEDLLGQGQNVRGRRGVPEIGGRCVLVHQELADRFVLRLQLHDIHQSFRRVFGGVVDVHEVTQGQRNIRHGRLPLWDGRQLRPVRLRVLLHADELLQAGEPLRGLVGKGLESFGGEDAGDGEMSEARYNREAALVIVQLPQPRRQVDEVGIDARAVGRPRRQQDFTGHPQRGLIVNPAHVVHIGRDELLVNPHPRALHQLTGPNTRVKLEVRPGQVRREGPHIDVYHRHGLGGLLLEDRGDTH